MSKLNLRDHWTFVSLLITWDFIETKELYMDFDFILGDGWQCLG